MFGKRPWLCWSSVCFVAAIGLYSVAGFVLAPRLIKGQLVRFGQESLRRKVRVDDVRINPYSLTLSIRGFDLQEAEGAPVVGFAELFVDVELSSLFRRTWTLAEIRLAEPRVRFDRFADGGSNFGRLISEWSSAPEAAAAPPNPAGEEQFLRLVVRRVTLQSGEVDVKDASQPTPFETRVGPLDLEIRDFSTLPDQQGNHTIDVGMEEGARLRWSGTFSTNPVRSAGHLSVQGERLRLLWRYIQDQIRFEVVKGMTAAEADYVVAVEAGEPRARLENVSVSVKGLAVRPADATENVIILPDISLTGGEIEYPARKARVKELRVSGARLVTWRDRHVTLNLADLFVPVRTTDSPSDEGASEDGPVWTLDLDRLLVEDFAAGFEDRGVREPFHSGVEDMRIEVRGFSLTPGSRADIEWSMGVTTGGTVSGAGSFGIDPPAFEGILKIEKLSLAPVQPYLRDVAKLQLESGDLGMELQIASSPEETLRAQGQLEITDLAAKDTLVAERFLAWKRLGVRDALFELSGRKFETPEVDFNALYGRIAIAKDGSTNIGDVLASAAEPDAASRPVVANGAEATPFAVSIGRVSIHDSSASFADLSLPLPFAVGIHGLHGNISKIRSTPGAVSKVSLKGVVEKYGSCVVKGSLNLFAPDRNADVAVEFENIEMSKLSPYTAKFAGYEIDGGKLSLDLSYQISDRKLNARNKILIDKLELGRQVDSPGATDLPLRLAVALLKDPDGRIDIKVPVQGSLDDPRFSYGQALRKALRDLLGNVATAPFKLLADLVGAGDKKLDSVWFDPAGAELSPPQREKLEKLAQAMRERPRLVLSVRGRYDPKLDPAALGARTVELLIGERLGIEPAADGELPLMPPDERRDALEEMYRDAFSRTELENLEAVHTRSALEGEEEGVLDEEAYLDALVGELAKRQDVREEDLVAVADARARAILEFLRGAGVAEERIRFLAGQANDKAREKRIPVKLEIKAQ